jgi:ribosomal protein L31E
MPVELLTYEALAARLDISGEGARSLARRLRLPRSRSSDGKAVVTVDVGEIGQRRPAFLDRMTKLAGLQAEVARLDATVAMHRADFERERERADRLAEELVKLAAEATSVREVTIRLERDLTALRIAGREQPPSRLRRLATSIVDADRRACR